MSDEVWRRERIESPCVKICVIHPGAGLCVGCYRTPDEIARWTAMTPDERREIMDGLADRAPRLTAPGARASRRTGRGRGRR